MRRKDKIYQHIQQKTLSYLENQESELQTDALSLSLDLKIERANISRELNKMWREGELIKIAGRPVFFLTRATILENYPGIFMPSTIAKDDSLGVYLSGKTKRHKELEKREADPFFDLLIGKEGSLSEQIKNAKSALSYPPIGLHTLLLGEYGVGKTKFTSCMHLFFRQLHHIKDNQSLTTVSCTVYSEDHSKFEKLLFGEKETNASKRKSRKGLLEGREKGIILLRDIEALSDQSIEVLSTLCSANRYIASDGSSKPLNHLFIGTSHLNEEQDRIQYIAQQFPVTITMPSLEERGVHEKLELILHLFSLEAKIIEKPISVHKDIITTFCSRRYSKNLTQLRNEIKYACSKAYLDIINTDYNVIYVSYQHLSTFMISLANTPNERLGDILSLMNSVTTDYLYFSTDGEMPQLNPLKNKTNLQSISEAHIDSYIDTWNRDVALLDDYDDYVNKNLVHLSHCSDLQLEQIRKNINPLVYNILISRLQLDKKYTILTSQTNLLYGILLHLCNLVSRQQSDIKEVTTSGKALAKSIYPLEWKIANDVFSNLQSVYDRKFSIKERDFFAAYLSLAYQWVTKTPVAILVIAHGEATASDMANYVKQNVKGNFYIDSINYTSKIQLNDCLELACLKSSALNKGSGVLIVTDMHPLKSIHEYVQSQTSIPCKTIAPLSLPDLIQIVEMTVSGVNNLEMIFNHFEEREGSDEDGDDDGIQSRSFIENVKTRIIAKSTVFIDVDKAVNVLIKTMNEILNELYIPYSEEITVKFLCHSVNMVERVIKNEIWNYDLLNQFVNENYDIFHVVENAFEFVNATYEIHIPVSELVYVTQIFQAYVYQ